jgi:predicted transcriptional regulator
LRAHIEVIADILNETKEVASRNQIMSECNISSIQMGNYLSLLQDLGLLKVTSVPKEEKQFRITEKGSRFLENYFEIKIQLQVCIQSKDSISDE